VVRVEPMAQPEDVGRDRESREDQSAARDLVRELVRQEGERGDERRDGSREDDEVEEDNQ